MRMPRFEYKSPDFIMYRGAGIHYNKHIDDRFMTVLKGAVRMAQAQIRSRKYRSASGSARIYRSTS